jgi:hypothetical protein
MADGTPPDPEREPWGADLASLERERLLSYVEWAEVATPWWYWPIYGTALAGFVAAYSFGMIWGTLGAVAFAAAMGALIGAVTSRSGVSTPRFRAMPGRLRVTFLPILLALLAALGAIASALVVVEDPPFVLLGLAIGAGAALAGWGHTVWYRREARQLARDHGLR